MERPVLTWVGGKLRTWLKPGRFFHAIVAASALFGCGTESVTPPAVGCSQGGVACSETVAARCAEACGDIVSCSALTWAAANTDQTSCGTSLVEAKYECGKYHVRALGSADFQDIYYYEASSGDLVAIEYQANASSTCVAGPVGLTLPVCPGAH